MTQDQIIALSLLATSRRTAPATREAIIEAMSEIERLSELLTSIHDLCGEPGIPEEHVAATDRIHEMTGEFSLVNKRLCDQLM